MEQSKKQEVVLNAIHKIVGDIEINFAKNILEYMGPLDAVYVIHMIEQEVNIDLSYKFMDNPDILTVNGLIELI